MGASECTILGLLGFLVWDIQFYSSKLEKPPSEIIKKGAKWPIRPKYVEVASEGKQNDEDGDDGWLWSVVQWAIKPQKASFSTL